MKNNPEHDKKGSKTLISRDEGRLHPPPPCRRSKKETEGDLHATRSLRLSFWTLRLQLRRHSLWQGASANFLLCFLTKNHLQQWEMSHTSSEAGD